MHIFNGSWITSPEFENIKGLDIFSDSGRAISRLSEDSRNIHSLFRDRFVLKKENSKTIIFISADDYYKLYINGMFISSGPAPCYHTRQNYNTIDITDYVRKGENLIALHCYYQGLINRVWQSGDFRHAVIYDIYEDEDLIALSSENTKYSPHTGYSTRGTVGYSTQFLEDYDSTSDQDGFEKTYYDDSSWQNSKLFKNPDWCLCPQASRSLVYEKILPTDVNRNANSVTFDFGACYVGQLSIKLDSLQKQRVRVLYSQELDSFGEPMYALRANCVYEEFWTLKEGISTLDNFDYKSFRYAKLIFEDKIPEIISCALLSRHHPFELKRSVKAEYKDDLRLGQIWKLCVNSYKYGVQETVQDCMEREKGFYVGDGCYSALTYAVLTDDLTVMEKLIDDAFASSFISDTLVSCPDASFVQEIAEFPLMLCSAVLWHFRLSEEREKEYLKANLKKVITLLEHYREKYENDHLLSNLDKWCVVEWPDNCRDGYDAGIVEGMICTDTHISINAYYIEAIKNANKACSALDLAIYRDTKPLIKAFTDAFYCKDTGLFVDRVGSTHTSVVGNIFPFAFGLCPDTNTAERIAQLINKKGISSLSLFCTFPALMGFVRYQMHDRLKNALLEDNAWLATIRQGSSTTFEGFRKETKKNCSLFHLTMAYGALFLADYDIEKLFK